MRGVIPIQPIGIVGKSGPEWEIDSFNRGRIQSPPIELFGDNFIGDTFDVSTTGKWVETITGTGGVRSVVDRTLTLQLGTAVAKIEEVARAPGLAANVGDFSLDTNAFSIGSNRPANYRIRVGYRNTPKTDGVYFEIIEGTVFWYTLLNGTPTAQKDISSVLTDPDVSGGNVGIGAFALWQIEHLEAGKINIKIAGKQFDTTIAGGATLTGDSEKIPFIEVENTAITGSIPTKFEMHWVKLSDENGTKFQIAGKNSRGLLQDLLLTENGEVPVVITAGAAPPSTTAVGVIEEDSMSGILNNFYVIPSGDTLTLQEFTVGGDPTSNSGHKVSLYKSPNGIAADAIEANLLTPSGFSSNFTTTVPDSFVGDGTFAILLRREVLGGGTKQVSGFWRGFLTPP